MKVKRLIAVPMPMRCWTCEFEGRSATRRQTDMYICSTEHSATAGAVVLWKCPRCGKTKAERFSSKEEAVAFWKHAYDKKWVILNDSIYKGRVP